MNKAGIYPIKKKFNEFQPRVLKMEIFPSPSVHSKGERFRVVGTTKRSGSERQLHMFIRALRAEDTDGLDLKYER